MANRVSSAQGGWPGRPARWLLAIFLAAGPFAAADHDIRLGAYRLCAAPVDILDAAAADRVASALPPDEALCWEVVVPDTYDSARPAGLLVYISPGDSGALPRGWNTLLEAHNLVWISANASGNRHPVIRRVLAALLATTALGDDYATDPARIYLAGFSGGARVAGLLAPTYPTLFRGAIYVGGAEPWDESSKPVDLAAMRANRYAFVVGADDEVNRVSAVQVQGDYERAGIHATKLIVARRTGHRLPSLSYLDESLNFLDGTRGAAEAP